MPPQLMSFTDLMHSATNEQGMKSIDYTMKRKYPQDTIATSSCDKRWKMEQSQQYISQPLRINVDMSNTSEYSSLDTSYPINTYISPVPTLLQKHNIRGISPRVSSKDITFEMLQPHFDKPLQFAATYFGVCTTILKKICRKLNIPVWPHRKISDLRKTLRSMEQQVDMFEGEQRRIYATQMQRLKLELESFLRTGNRNPQPIKLTSTPTIEEQQYKYTYQSDSEDRRRNRNQVVTNCCNSVPSSPHTPITPIVLPSLSYMLEQAKYSDINFGSSTRDRS